MAPEWEGRAISAGPGVVAPASRPLAGLVRVPSDKAISHRAAILGALAGGTTVVRDFSPAGDCAATLAVLAALGVGIERVDRGRSDRHGSAKGAAEILVRGVGPDARLAPPPAPLHCGRSGTTMRMLAGALAGFPSRFAMTGDPQLLRRPMERVAEPLRRMGAGVDLAPGGTPPMVIEGGALHGIEYRLPVASAQVKSAVLLAGLHAEGVTAVVEPVPTRDHTERLLEAMGAAVEAVALPDGARRVTLAPGPLRGVEVDVPGDPSSAAPLVAAATLVPGSDLVIEGVGTNPGRTGFLRVAGRMGARIEILPRPGRGPEPVADLHVRHASLTATTIGAAEVPSLVDELPLVALLASRAEGVTEVRGAEELRVKESDRIAGIVQGLRALGADAEELPDGFVVRGPVELSGGTVEARADHRLAMAFAVAALVSAGPVAIDGLAFVGDSFPGFLELLEGVR